jgi:hypothetical protein
MATQHRLIRLSGIVTSAAGITGGAICMSATS